MPSTTITGPFRPRIPMWNTRGRMVWERKTSSIRPAPGEPARAAIVIDGRVYFRASATDRTVPPALAKFAERFPNGEWVAPGACPECHGTRYAWGKRTKDGNNPGPTSERKERKPCAVCKGTGVIV